jgi:hypothetical protein
MTDYTGSTVKSLLLTMSGDDPANVDPILKAWSSTAEVLDTYHTILTDLGNDLFTAWKPQAGSAAEQFKNFVDAFLLSIDDTATCASKNYTALSKAVSSTMDAKKTIQQIAQEMTAAGLDTDGQGGIKFLSDVYHMRAQLAMQTADTYITEANSTFLTPVAFSLGDGERDNSSAGSKYSQTGTSVTGNSGFLSGFTSQPVASASAITVPDTNTSSTQNGTGNTGGTLAGAQIAGNSLPGSASVLPSARPAPYTSPVTSNGLRVMPYGTVIGEQPPTAGRADAGSTSSRARSGTSERSGANSGTGTRANGAPTRRSGSTSTQSERTAGGARGRTSPGQSYRKRRPRDENGQPIWDRDNPWEIEQGIPPVLEAPAEPTRHDPGPGVIGIDR